MKVNGRFISFGSARFSLTIRTPGAMTLNKIRTEGNARKGTGVDGENSVVPSCHHVALNRSVMVGDDLIGPSSVYKVL